MSKGGITVKVDMKPVDQILKDHGLDEKGDVQLMVTNMINHRITRYMPKLTGVLSSKLKHIKSPTIIEIEGPYAQYQYFGNVMIGPPQGPKVATSIPLKYTKTHHPLAGPYWYRRLMSAEGAAIAGEVEEYIRRKK